MDRVFEKTAAELRPRAPGDSVRIRQGEVITLNTDHTVDVTIGGGQTVSTVKYLGSAYVNAGSQVWLLTDGYDWIALGGLAQYSAPPTIILDKTNDQPITNGGYYAVTFGSPNYVSSGLSDDGMYSGTNTTRIVATLPGYYYVYATLYGNPTVASASIGRAQIRKNGASTGLIATGTYSAGTGQPHSLNPSGVVNLAANDYLEVFVYFSAASVSILGTGEIDSGAFGMTYLGPAGTAPA